MTRKILVLFTLLLLAGLGLGADPASAELGERDWLSSFGNPAPVASSARVERRNARNTRAAPRRLAAKRRAAPARLARRSAPRAPRAASVTGSRGLGSSGIASYYWQGQRTATGERFNPSGLTAAHRTLPFGTRVRVTNLANGRAVTVRINDRGPFIAGRVIDLSRGAAQAVGMTGAGLARVNVAVIGR